MKLSAHQNERRKILEAIYLRAWTDEILKNCLLLSPENTLEKICGVKFPSDKQVIVVDQSNPDCIYINIPRRPTLDI